MVISTVKSQTYDTTFYNEDSGLTQWHVTQMLQDHNGMMWFSTWNGLNRFDGKEFIAFKSKAGDGIDKENSFGSDKFKRADVGFKLGCGAEYNKLYLEAGYQFGISNIADWKDGADDASVHNGAFFVNLGVNF